MDAVGTGGREVDALELSAASAYAQGDLEGAIGAWEQVHALQQAAGQHAEAARAATMIAMYLMMDTGLMSPVRGWLARAERLLTDLGETPVHAMIAMLRAYERFMCGDMVAVAHWAARAIDVGDRHGVPPASTLGRVADARARIFAGEVDEGLATLDEVAVVLMTRELDPLTTGMVWCELVCALQGLGQYDRAEEWTAAMDAWRVDGTYVGGINGRCRVHRAEMLRLRGDCAEAEEEALQACDALRPWMRREFGWPLTELGVIRLRRGDHAGAEEAFLAAHANGWDPQPGLALLRLAAGDAATAHTMVDGALRQPTQVPWKERPPNVALSRVPLLDAKVEIALAVGEVDGAREASEELDDLETTYPSEAFRAVAALARGRVRLAEGDAAAAVAACEQAVTGWCDVRVPWETAAARLVLARAAEAAGDPARAELEEAAARAALHDIGGTHWTLPNDDGPTGGATPPDPAPRVGEAVFRADGQMRTVTFAGATALLKDLKGMRYLERLLAEPGREFHALDLVAVEHGSLPTAGPAAEVGELRVASGDTGPVIDDQARQAYRRRLVDVESDIEDAEAMGDIARAELARVDRDFLVSELSRAFGIGGRQRPTGSDAERARTSVTRAVKYAMERIAEHHSALSDHLERTVHTGIYCSYTPDPMLHIRWDA